MLRFLVFLLCAISILSASNAFDCGRRTYFADVQGLTIRCRAFPSFESKHTACFRDLWWKYLAYNSWQQPQTIDADPFSVLISPACAKPCRCKMTFNFAEFSCTPRGRAPAWSDDYRPNRRSGAYCKELRLPREIQNNRQNVTVAVVLSGLALEAERTLLLPDLAIALDAIGIEALEIDRFKITGNPKPPLTSVDSLFRPGRFMSLTSFSFGLTRDSAYTPLAWPGLSKALGSLSGNITFLTLSSINTTLIPEPSFARALEVFVCVRCFGLNEAPEWLELSTSLSYLHFSNVATSFPYWKFPRASNLLHFALCDTQIKDLSSGFSLANLYPNLESLDLSNLGLAAIPFGLARNLKQLKRLDLSGNTLIPLPSFESLGNLKVLNLDGVSTIYGSPTNAPTCLYGDAAVSSTVFESISGKSIQIGKEDFRYLGNLESLSISYYQNILIDEEAFKPLKRLKYLYMNGLRNLTKFPDALAHTCGLQGFSANTLSFAANVSTFDVIPFYIPKFYKKLRQIDLSFCNLTVVPSGLLALDRAQVLRTGMNQWLENTLYLNPTLSKNRCEMFKIATMFLNKGSRSLSGWGSADERQRCQMELDAQLRISEERMKRLKDACNV